MLLTFLVAGYVQDSMCVLLQICMSKFSQESSYIIIQQITALLDWQIAIRYTRASLWKVSIITLLFFQIFWSKSISYIWDKLVPNLAIQYIILLQTNETWKIWLEWLHSFETWGRSKNSTEKTNIETCISVAEMSPAAWERTYSCLLRDIKQAKEREFWRIWQIFMIIIFPFLFFHHCVNKIISLVFLPLCPCPSFVTKNCVRWYCSKREFSSLMFAKVFLSKHHSIVVLLSLKFHKINGYFYCKCSSSFHFSWKSGIGLTPEVIDVFACPGDGMQWFYPWSTQSVCPFVCVEREWMWKENMRWIEGVGVTCILSKNSERFSKGRKDT